MTSVIPTSEFFTAGGTLPPDAPSYVKRPTDEELYQNIKAGEFCYVLTPRQMGKSSLMIRTSRRLMEEGVKSAIVDLTQIGTVESEDQWYKGILSQIRRRLRMSLDPVTWWEQRRDIPNIQKFIEFFEEALLEVREPVVIFMDEIDTTLKLDFRDNFFAGIRALYNARAENPDLRRITFVLLGVASPSDLIKDRTRTPFNIGQEIPLKPFSREDARMLEQGLEAVYPGLGSQILNRVFYWTNGHPYLTQKICQSVVDEPFPFYDDGQVDHMVEKLFISEEASRETNLQFVRDSVLNHPDRKDILSVYKKILQGKEVRDNKNSVSQNHLKLAGLVRVDDGRLVASNRIYARVFDAAWINRYTEVNWSRRVSVALGVIVLLLLSVIAYDAMYLPNRSLQASDEVISYNRDDRGVRALAKLFELNPILLQNEYEYKAKDLFFNTLSREEQIELIDIDSYEGRRLSKSPDFKKDYKTVILGLYTSLADVDRSGQSTALLEEMQDSLKNLEMQDDPLYREIMYWVAARKGGLSDAFQNYSEAIQENPKNPATQFEMARIYVERVGYADALQAYDSVLAIVPESDIEPTAGPAPTGISGTAETAAATSSSANATAGSTPLPQSTPTTGPARSVTTPVTPPTPEITATTTSPFQSRFLTRGQRIAAVRNDITQNAALYAFYVQDQAGSYPNLVKNVPQQAETPAPGDGSSAAVQVVEFYFQNINNATQPDDLIHSWNLLTTRLQNSPNGRFTNFRDFWWQWYVSYRIYDCGSSIVSVEYRLEQRDPSSFLSPSQEFVRYILTEEKGQLKIDEGIVIDSLGSECTLAVEFLATELTTPASTANPAPDAKHYTLWRSGTRLDDHP